MNDMLTITDRSYHTLRAKAEFAGCKVSAIRAVRNGFEGVLDIPPNRDKETVQALLANYDPLSALRCFRQSLDRFATQGVK